MLVRRCLDCQRLYLDESLANPRATISQPASVSKPLTRWRAVMVELSTTPNELRRASDGVLVANCICMPVPWTVQSLIGWRPALSLNASWSCEKVADCGSVSVNLLVE